MHQIRRPRQFAGMDGIANNPNSCTSSALWPPKRSIAACILVPLATLRSLTQGRATYAMEFKHYAEVPKHILDQISVSKTRA